MKTVTIRQAKANLSRLIAQACEGEEIVITRGPKPVARLVPIADHKGLRRPGALRGVLKVGAEFFEPPNAEELAGWD